MINISISELNFLTYIVVLGAVVSLPFGFLIGLINIFRIGFKEDKKFWVIASEYEGYLFFCFVVFLVYLFSYLSTKINLIP